MNSRGFWRRGWLTQVMAFVILLAGVVSANAWNIEGTVTNSSGKTGSRVYISLNSQYGGEAQYGVSIPAPAPGASAGYIIRGVPDGNYIANAFLDRRTNTSATHHANDPVGSSQTIFVDGGDVVNDTDDTADLTLNLPDPVFPAPSAPTLNGVIPGPGAALVNWDTPTNNNGNEIAYSYNVYWHTANTVSPTVYTGKKIGIPARDDGMYLQTMLNGTTPLANGTTLWYVVTGQFGTNGTEGSVEGPASNTFGPVTIGDIPSDNISSFGVSGTINLDPAITPITGPLFVVVTDDGPGTRISKIDNPGTSTPFTVTGVPNGNYYVFSLVDQNKDGVIWTGDYTVGDMLAPAITVNGANVPGITSTIPKKEAETSVATSHYIEASGLEGYGLDFSVRSAFRQPVNVAVRAGQDVAGPVDLVVRQSGDFDYWLNDLPRPAVGTEYTLDIGYSDGTTGSETVTVTGVVDSFADPVSPKGKVTFNPTPMFSWTAPTSPPAGYAYSLNLNGDNLWWDTDRMPATQTSALFNFNDWASSNFLSDNAAYTWEIAVNDLYGNEARKQATFFSGGSISGTVKGSDTSSGVAGIYLQLYDGSGTPISRNNNMTTAADGSFLIGGLQTGTYRVCFWPNQTGYVAQCYDSKAFNGSQATDISVTYPNNTALNPITLVKSATITGTVTTSGGGPIQGVSVELRYTDGNWVNGVNMPITDASGNYTLSGFQPGSYRLYFNGAAQGYIGQWYDGKSDLLSADIITLSTGQSQTANATLTLGGILTGQVTNGTSGLQGIWVELHDINGNWVQGINNVMTDASGNYSLAGLSTGIYKVYFNGSSSGYSSQWYNGKTDSGSADELNVTAGNTYPLADAVLTAVPPISVSGSVVDSSQIPLGGITIEQLNSANTTTSAPDGTFTINDIPGGIWFELKMSLGTTYVPTYSGWLSSLTNMTLLPYTLFTGSEVSGYLGSATTGAAIIGRLVNSVNPSSAVSGGTVTASGPSPSYVVRYFDSASQQFTGTTATDASGMFLIRNVENGANISINASIGMGGNGWLNVNTHAPGVSEVVVLCNMPTIGVSGQVLDASQTMITPVQNATVSVASLPISTITDSFGGYNLNGLPSGTDFSLSFSASGFDTAYSATINSTNFLNVNMGLFPTGSFATWNSSDTSTGVIRGRVADQYSGSGIVGARVTAPVGYTVMYDDGSGNMIADTGTTITAANGVFYITHVPNGATVSLSATKLSYNFNSVVAAGHAGAITSVEVRGNLVVSVSGSVVNSSNTPLAGVTITQVGTSNTATTAADGSFTISNLPGGTGFELMMSLPGYVSNYTGPLTLTNSIALPSPVVLYTTTEFASTGITPGKGAIIGRVVNSANPVATLSGMQVTTSPGYAVYYFDQTYNSGAGGFSPTATTTDASGLFLVANVDDQVGLSLDASNPPANTIFGNTYLTTHANAITQIAVPCTLPTIGVSGQVTDASTYSGIPNATVAVNSLPISTNTTEFGYFDLNSVPSGTDFSLSFSATGYDTAYSATLNSTSYLMNVNMALFPSGSFAAWNGGDASTGLIRGRVFNQFSGGIAGATVSAPGYTVIYDDGSGNLGADTTTANNGVFYITGVADGASVTISAAKQNYLFNPVGAVGHAGAITSVEVHGEPVISVSGSVVDISNAPLSGVTIEQLNSTNTATSIIDGTFTINNLTTNGFELKMTKGTTYVPTYSNWLTSSTDLAIPYPYVLFTPDEVSTFLGIASGKGAVIGRLVNSANPAVTISGGTVTADGLSISYYDSATQQFSASATTTDASGLFLVRDVTDNGYLNLNATIGTTGYGYLSVTTHAPGVSEVILPCNLPTVGWGNLQWPASITAMTNQPTEFIYGQVYMWGITDTAPGPAPGLVAELGYGPVGTAPSSQSWVWKTAAYTNQVGGNYEYAATLSVPTAGSYDYAYRYSYYGGVYVYGDMWGLENADSPLPNAGKLTVNAPPVSVSGYVYTKAGAPVEGATVTIVGNPELTTNTAGDGSYTINGIQVGQDFQVKASKVGYVDAYSATFNTTGSNVNARDLVLLAPAEVNGISPTTGGISGRTIIGGVGTPVAGATVSIVSSSGGPYTVMYDDGTGNFSSAGPTSSNGRFFIPNIADEDTVVLSASRPGWTINGQKSYVVHANAVTQGNLAGAFTTNMVVLLDNGSNFLSLDAAVKASLDTETLLIRDTHFQEELTVDYTPLRPSPTPFTITLKGGLGSDFSTPAATATSLRKLTIKNGKVIANRMVVKPD